MNSHITVERLSAYLDEELDERELARVERHLDECVVCRRHLAGLKRVVTGLRSLERASPPPILDQMVERRVSLDAPPQTLGDRLQARLAGRQRIDPTVGIGFALVVALAAIVYLFAEGVERRKTDVPIIVPAPGLVLEVELRRLGNRVFERRQAGWQQQDVRGAADRHIGAGSEAGRELIDAHPWLQELLRDGEWVVLELDGEILELRR